MAMSGKRCLYKREARGKLYQQTKAFKLGNGTPKVRGETKSFIWCLVDGFPCHTAPEM